MADLAKLVVSLEAQTAKYQKDMEKANKRTERFAKKTKSSLATVAKAFAGLAIGNSLKSMITDFAATADRAAKFSTRIGISVEALSQLQFAAERSGVSARTLEMGMQRMTRRLSEVAATGKGEAAPALDELGLSAKKLAKLRPEQQLAILADAFQGVESQGDKVRLAMKLFDSEGVALLQTLDGGAAGLQAMADESDRLGNTLDSETTKAAEDFNDAITNMKASSVGFRKELFTNLAPQLTSMASVIGEKMPMAAELFAKAFILMQSAVTGSAGVFSHIVGIARKSASSIVNIFGADTLADVLSMQGDEALATAKLLFDQMEVTFTSGMAQIDARIKADNEKRENPFDVDLSDVSQPKKLPILGGGKSPVDPMLKEIVAEINAEFARGRAIYEKTRTPLEELLATYAELNDLLSSGAIPDQETYNRAVIQAGERFNQLTTEVETAADQMTTFSDQAARNMQDAFADFLFDPFEDGIQGMLKSFLSAIQRMIAEQAAAQLFGDKSEGGLGLGGLLKTGVSAGLGALGIPQLAKGGRASAGKPHIIGEVGPELFIPDSSGMVIPNDQLGAQRSGGNVTINVSTPDAASFRKAQSRISMDFTRQLARA